MHSTVCMSDVRIVLTTFYAQTETRRREYERFYYHLDMILIYAIWFTEYGERECMRSGAMFVEQFRPLQKWQTSNEMSLNIWLVHSPYIP